MPQRVTRQTIRLLEALLSDPGRDWYGLELMDQAELRSGTAYPLLHRLEGEGWLASTPEDVDPHQEGRPRRRLYRLTAHGVAEATRALEPSQRKAKDRAPRPIAVPRGATL
jgi:DNA-binding PadR family transcriptional regulator